MLLHPTVQATTLLLWGIVWHLCADWLLQNDYISRNKSSLKHPASYFHALIHLNGLLCLFPLYGALAVAAVHLLIDTRVPLTWWRKAYQQTTEGDVVLHVAIWSDQALHIFVLAVVSLLVSR